MTTIQMPVTDEQISKRRAQLMSANRVLPKACRHGPQQQMKSYCLGDKRCAGGRNDSEVSMERDDEKVLLLLETRPSERRRQSHIQASGELAVSLCVG